MGTKEKQQELPDDDRAVFLPMEDIQAIEGIINKMEQAQLEFRIVEESMKPIENGEFNVENKR